MTAPVVNELSQWLGEEKIRKEIALVHMHIIYIAPVHMHFSYVAPMHMDSLMYLY